MDLTPLRMESTLCMRVAGYADVELLEKLKEGGGVRVAGRGRRDYAASLLRAALGIENRYVGLIDNGGRNESVSTKHDPLMYAIGKRVEESVSCLIDYGFDVNRDVGGGLSSLLLASLMGEKKIAEMLLEAGAVWDFQSAQSENALRQLIRMDSPELLNGLIRTGTRPRTQVNGNDSHGRGRRILWSEKTFGRDGFDDYSWFVFDAKCWGKC